MAYGHSFLNELEKLTKIKKTKENCRKKLKLMQSNVFGTNSTDVSTCSCFNNIYIVFMALVFKLLQTCSPVRFCPSSMIRWGCDHELDQCPVHPRKCVARKTSWKSTELQEIGICSMKKRKERSVHGGQTHWSALRSLFYGEPNDQLIRILGMPITNLFTITWLITLVMIQTNQVIKLT